MGSVRLAAGRGVRQQRPGLGVGGMGEWLSLCVAGSTEVVRTVGEACENPVEMPATAVKPIEQWLHAQANITLLQLPAVGAASLLHADEEI